MITVRELTKKYHGRVILDDVSIDIPAGQITFLMGENGAGKTTLLKAMLGLEGCDGHVLYDERSLREVYGTIAVVYDDSPAYRRLTGYQNIEILCARNVSNAEIDNVTTELLSKAELNRQVSRYSYGQKKKLSIAIGLLGEPRYLLMDEVSNGLDYETMQWLKQELKERSADTTTLLTGHQFDFYNTIVDGVLVLHDARIQEVALRDQEPSDNMLGALYEARIKNA